MGETSCKKFPPRPFQELSPLFLQHPRRIASQTIPPRVLCVLVKAFVQYSVSDAQTLERRRSISSRKRFGTHDHKTLTKVSVGRGFFMGKLLKKFPHTLSKLSPHLYSTLVWMASQTIPPRVLCVLVKAFVQYSVSDVQALESRR